jgi:hypothetical protein
VTHQNLSRIEPEANRPPVFRALSLIQPWAWAVVFGPKWIENRVWWSELTGPIWLASSAQVTRPYYREARELILRIAERTSGPVEVPHLDDLTYGAVLGRAFVSDRILPGGYADANTRAGYESARRARTSMKLHGPQWGDELIKTGALRRHELAGTAWHFPDQYGYVLDDRRPLERAVPCIGHRKAWRMPPALVAAVRRVPLLEARPSSALWSRRT